MSTQEEWVSAVSGGASRRQVAADIGMPQSTYNRQANAGRFDAETVIAIARTYGIEPVSALAKLGFLTTDEAVKMDLHDAVRLLTDQQLVRELARRVDDNEAAWQGTFDDVVDDATRDLTSGQPVTIGTDDNIVTIDGKLEAARSSGITGDDDVDEPWAARKSNAPSPGRARRDALDAAGEESQDPDDASHGRSFD